MRNYKCLSVNHFTIGDYSLFPIRDEDKYAIMKWRNEQIDILRQKELLTKDQQEHYFKNVVDGLFEKEQPEQILWSFLYKDELIGYGGLVHIDWQKKEAEVSFINRTERSQFKETFISDWCNYLKLLKNLVNSQLSFKKIFTYAYDIRPLLYEALAQEGFKEAKRIPKAIEIKNTLFDVLIHEFHFDALIMKMAELSDVDQYYNWVNESLVRRNSFNSNQIDYKEHCEWFSSKLLDKDVFFYLFFNTSNVPVGQVRIEKVNDENVVDISIDVSWRGKGLSEQMLHKSTTDFFIKFPNEKIIAYVKKENAVSIKQFMKSNFQIDKEYKNKFQNCIKLIKSIRTNE